ncbi:hypothetical protein BV898_08505 [Hypsibius exemplaris]|uniref:G-protein coupled receptors family 1 profile domain-containing protein n=1 Tax=Hypsibius exemplaris TaxID=2072580 RepID=A0A1W0WQD1_HYPEX|nr:hypothetical protein BV898_08505 [Hypsibius exemplaris]
MNISFFENSTVPSQTNRVLGHEGTSLAWFVFSILCSIIGTALLLLLLLASFRVKRLRSGSSILVVHLMLIELIICGVTFPIFLITTHTGLTGVHVQVNCQVFMYFFLTTIHTEYWASLVLAVNRFFALVLPHHHRKLLSKTGLIIMILIPWIVGLGVTLPLYFGIGGRFILRTSPFESCAFMSQTSGYGIGLAFLGAYLPIGLIGLIYAVLGVRWLVGSFSKRFVAVQVVAAVGPAAAPSQGNVAAKTRRVLLLRMLVVTYLWHCLCFLPPPILISSFPGLVVSHPKLVSLWLFKTMLLCGYVVSPFIFLVLNVDYQKGVQNLFNIGRGAIHESRGRPSI